MKKNEKEIGLDLPYNRFQISPSLGGFGDQQHKNYIQVKRQKEQKNIQLHNQSIAELVQQFDSQLKQKLDQSQLFIIINDDLLSSVKSLNQNANADQIYKSGIKSIAIIDKEEIINYPKIQQYKNIVPYFNQSHQKNRQIKIFLIRVDQKNKEIEQAIQISSITKVSELKELIKNKYNYPAIYNILLQTNTGNILNQNSHTLIQQNITDNSKIHISLISVNACFLPNSKIKVIYQFEQTNKQLKFKDINLSQIKVGDNILSYCEQKQILQIDKVTYVQTLKSHIIMQIQLQNGQKIVSTDADTYLTQQGWKKHNFYNRQNFLNISKRLTKNDKLKYINFTQNNLEQLKPINQSIKNIQIKQYNQSIPLIHISVKKNHNFIINNIIVHNMTIIVKNSQNNQVFQINVNPKDLIKQIKNKINKIKQITSDKYILQFAHKQVQDQKSLIDYKINKGDRIFIHFKQKNKIKKQKNVDDLNLIIKHNTLTYNLRYKLNRDKKIHQIITNIDNTNPKYFTLIYGNIFLKPTDQLSIIQKYQSFKESSQIVCVVVQSAERKLFYSVIDQNQNINKKFSSQQQKKIIANFKNNSKNQKLNKAIFNFNYTKVNEKQKINQLIQTIQCFRNLSKYKNPVKQYPCVNIEGGDKINFLQYTLYSQLPYMKFSQNHQIGSAFYFRQFFQTLTADYRQIIKQNKQQKLTIFFVRSLTGVNLGETQQNNKIRKQVVFLPLTYFSIDNIIVDNIKNTSIQYIFVTQMPTLFNYQKKFILWVDDLPNNKSNKQIIQKFNNYQILKLVTTKQAQNWMKQFAWLFNLQGIKFKIISDMTRFDLIPPNQNDQQKKIFNNQYLRIKKKQAAAIDLIQIISQNIGFTTLTTIFCGDKQNALKKLKQRKLQRGENYQQIIVNDEQLIKNITQFLNGI